MILPTTHRRMTAAEYFQMPEGPPYFQLVNGELYMSPSPVWRHNKVLLKIARLIGNFLEDDPVGELQIAPSDVELGIDDVYQPDLYFISKERLNIINVQGAKGAPDLIMEILSPSTARLDRNFKRAVYQREGVREIWFVDLWHDQIAVHRFTDAEASAVITTLTLEDEITTPLLPGMTIALAKIFG